MSCWYTSDSRWNSLDTRFCKFYHQVYTPRISLDYDFSIKYALNMQTICIFFFFLSFFLEKCAWFIYFHANLSFSNFTSIRRWNVRFTSLCVYHICYFRDNDSQFCLWIFSVRIIFIQMIPVHCRLLTFNVNYFSLV